MTRASDIFTLVNLLCTTYVSPTQTSKDETLHKAVRRPICFVRLWDWTKLQNPLWIPKDQRENLYRSERSNKFGFDENGRDGVLYTAHNNRRKV